MSKEIILTVIDVTGTQNYIFRSNRLRESIGASELVAKATSWWVFDVLCNELNWKTNLDYSKNPTSPFDAIQDTAIESGLDAEVIYVGGGNALILFEADGDDGKEKAKIFARRYTKKLLRESPGLEVVVAHSSPFDIKDFSDDNNIRDKLTEVMERISVKKSCRLLSSKLEGLAVSVQCISTGGAASFDPKDEAKGKGEESRQTLEDKYGNNYVSAEVWAKLKAVDDANDRLRRDLIKEIKYTDEVKNRLGKNFDFNRLDSPLEFDNLGRTEGEASLIAVVHTDGNGMGKRIKIFGERPNIDSNRKWITKMREMSQSIDRANLEALQKMTDFLASKLDKDKDGNVVLKSEDEKTFRLKTRWIKKDGKDFEIICYPFRPIIFGGEDVAFICDGRISLDLTAFYLKALEETTLADGKPLYGRAGVAIVKSHYPFRRAYNLAEELASSAKERINEFTDDEKKEVSALDWHLAFTGLAGVISEIREREYEVEQGQLNMRPVSICKTTDSSDWRTWENFISVTREFQEKWKESRNKAKALREVLRGGESEVKNFLKLNKIEKLHKGNAGDWDTLQTEGWENKRCGYFDALEMMDTYFSLGEKAVTDCQEKSHKNEEESK